MDSTFDDGAMFAGEASWLGEVNEIQDDTLAAQSRLAAARIDHSKVERTLKRMVDKEKGILGKWEADLLKAAHLPKEKKSPQRTRKTKQKKKLSANKAKPKVKSKPKVDKKAQPKVKSKPKVDKKAQPK